jgi:hypothetical protein
MEYFAQEARSNSFENRNGKGNSHIESNEKAASK